MDIFNIYVNRFPSTVHSTSGEMTYDGIRQLFTLEDVERKIKKVNKTAIPRGEYRVVITYSNRFKKDLPILLNVPGFEGIRIHAGNTEEDTSGCILVGAMRGNNKIMHSKLALDMVLSRIVVAIACKQDVWIKITGQGIEGA